MRENAITKTIDLSANLERMYSCEWKAEIDYFLGNRLDWRFRVEGIVQKSTSNAFKHVRKETIKFEWISNNLKLGVEIARAEIEYAMNKARS